MKVKRHFEASSLLAAVVFLFLAGACSLPAKPDGPTQTGEVLPTQESSQQQDTDSLSTESASEDVSMNETEHNPIETNPLPSAGVRTLENFLCTALQPLGSTMYIWGGGWNEEDTGAGTDAVSLGVSPNWKAFADLQDADYDYRETRYQIHDGLDCSGYVGWVVYNTMETESGLDGYVLKSTETAAAYAAEGFGDFLPSDLVSDYLAGDIMSMEGHVWISLGTCGDGSVLLIHSSPPGVRLCGTADGDEPTQAVLLAQEYMSSHYPDWYSRYPDCTVGSSYLENASQMRWNTQTFPDAEEIRARSPEELLNAFLR